jgi:hypothetical protein
MTAGVGAPALEVARIRSSVRGAVFAPGDEGYDAQRTIV